MVECPRCSSPGWWDGWRSDDAPVYRCDRVSCQTRRFQL